MANPIVFELKEKQFTVPASEEISTQTQPTIKIERLPDHQGQEKRYRLTLIVEIMANQEYESGTSNKITPPGNYAVLADADTKKCGDPELEFKIKQIGGANDYQVKIDLKMVIPGSKGDHSN